MGGVEGLPSSVGLRAEPVHFVESGDFFIRMVAEGILL
jgi:hypothetical protein